MDVEQCLIRDVTPGTMIILSNTSLTMCKFSTYSDIEVNQTDNVEAIPVHLTVTALIPDNVILDKETVNICILIDSPIVTVCRWQKKVDMEPFEKTEVG